MGCQRRRHVQAALNARAMPSMHFTGQVCWSEEPIYFMAGLTGNDLFSSMRILCSSRFCFSAREFACAGTFAFLAQDCRPLSSSLSLSSSLYSPHPLLLALLSS